MTKIEDEDRLLLLPGVTRILDSDAAIAEMKSMLGQEYELLRAQLRTGILLLNSVANTVPDFPLRDSTAALLWLYLEALDATDVLIRAGAIGGAEIPARTVLEDGMQLIYLLESNDQLKALAYAIDRTRRNLAGFEKLAAGSSQKREFVTEARRSWQGFPNSWKKHPDTSEQAEDLRGHLSQGIAGKVNAELESLNGAPWYAAFGGPRDLIQLAREVHMELWHRTLYAPWSDRVHGRASHKAWVLTESGEVYLNKLRSTDEWSSLLVMLYTLNKRVLSLVSEHFRPESVKTLAKWCEVGDEVLRKCLERNGKVPPEDLKETP